MNLTKLFSKSTVPAECMTETLIKAAKSEFEARLQEVANSLVSELSMKFNKSIRIELTEKEGVLEARCSVVVGDFL